MKKKSIIRLISCLAIVAAVMIAIFFKINIERTSMAITEDNVSTINAWNEVHVGGDDYQMEYNYDITPIGHCIYEITSTYNTVETLEYTKILHKNMVYTRVRVGPFNYKVLESHSEYCNCDISRG